VTTGLGPPPTIERKAIFLTIKSNIRTIGQKMVKEEEEEEYTL
jgi:hypothetical protein